jgi:hypothetical protein
MTASQKCCVECGAVRPDTPEHYPVYQKRQDRCVACVGAMRRQRRERKQEARERKMRLKEEKAVDAWLNAARTGGTDIPHSAELLENVMHQFGGVNGFSSLLLKNYFDSKPGSAQRTKILEMITRLVTTNADQGGSKKPLAFWTEEELEAEMNQRLEQAVVSMVGSPKLLTITESVHETITATAASTDDQVSA